MTTPKTDLTWTELKAELVAMLESMEYEKVEKVYNFCTRLTDQPEREPIYPTDNAPEPVWRKKVPE